MQDLERQKSETQPKHKEEIKRIRQFYEVIAFAKSRFGRSAMGTFPVAGELIRDMNSMFNDNI